jgi:peptide/nickel transport system substrate-binding protein
VPPWLRALAGALIVVLTGCSHAVAPAVPASVRFDIAADPTTLDPLFAHPDADNVEVQLARLVFLPFIDVDARGREFPVLLARIPTVANGDLSRDGTTIVYRLRAARWADGVPVTANDVVWTIHAILDPRNPVRSREGWDRIASAVALDARTVRVRLRAPWAPAVETFFTYGAAQQFVLPAHLLARERDLVHAPFNAAPVGDGPYRLVAWQRGDRLVYAASPGGGARVARLEVRVVTDPQTNFTLLKSGTIDWNLIAPIQRASLDGVPDLRFRSAPLMLVAGIALNVTHAPLDDVRVRRAIAAAIDRDAISKKLTFGAYPPVDTAQPLASWARDPHVRLPAFSPAAADALLDAAGWRRGAGGLREKDGRRLALTYVQFPESSTGVRVAQFVQNELRARGIDLAIKSVSNAQLFLPAADHGTLATGAFDLAYVPWAMGLDPDDAFLLRCHGAGNIMRWCDPQVDSLETQALAIPDRAQRARLYAAIERRVAADVPIVYLFDPAYVFAYRAELGGFAPNAFSPTWNARAWTLASPH